MNTDTQGSDFIAERWWDYHVSPSEKIPVRVAFTRFTRPAQGTRGKLWEARFLIFWPDGNIIERTAFGPDSADALILLVELFRIECEKLKAKMGEKITLDSGGSLFGYDFSAK